MAALDPLLRSELLAQILRLVLLDGGEWTAESIAEAVDAPYPTVTKEIRRLERAGIVSTRAVGRTKFVAASRGDDVVRALKRVLALPESAGGGGHVAKKKDKKKKDGKKKK